MPVVVEFVVHKDAMSADGGSRHQQRRSIARDMAPSWNRRICDGDRSQHAHLERARPEQARVLARIAGLISRRGYNIESLAVGPTESREMSRMTLQVNVEDVVLEQITKQLNKLIEVLKIVELEDSAVRRELVPGGQGNRRDSQPAH
jgi:acetolactate synthase regulatory subunit